MGKDAWCPGVTDTPETTLIVAALQLELALLMEELESLVVGPLPKGRQGLWAASRLELVGADICALSKACEVMLRRSTNARDETGL